MVHQDKTGTTQTPNCAIAHKRRIRDELTLARRRYTQNSVALVIAAIESSPNRRLTLREIYAYIHMHNPDMFPLEYPACRGWQNTVRYNLSSNLRFVRVSPVTGEPLDGLVKDRRRHMCWALRESSDVTHSQSRKRLPAVLPNNLPEVVAKQENAAADPPSVGSPVAMMPMNPLSVALLIN